MSRSDPQPGWACGIQPRMRGFAVRTGGCGQPGRTARFVCTLAALLLASCNDDRAVRADWAREWLESFVREHGLAPGLRAGVPRITEKLDIAIDVTVLNPVKARELRTFSRMDQILVLQLVCPPKDAKFWRILADDQSLWVDLGDERGSIIKATCKRPKGTEKR